MVKNPFTPEEEARDAEDTLDIQMMHLIEE